MGNSNHPSTRSDELAGSTGGPSIEGLEAYEICDVLETAARKLHEAGNLDVIPVTIGDLIGRQETSEGVAATRAVLRTLQRERADLRSERDVVEATKVDFQIGLLEVVLNAGKLTAYHREEIKE